jgi:hypothetical protein
MACSNAGHFNFLSEPGSSAISFGRTSFGGIIEIKMINSQHHLSAPLCLLRLNVLAVYQINHLNPPKTCPPERSEGGSPFRQISNMSAMDIPTDEYHISPDHS